MKTKNIISTGLTHGMCLTELTLESSESTEKHFHKKTTEVYSILSGNGLIICGDLKNQVGPNSLVVIEPYTEHQIINTGLTPLVILSCKDKPRQVKDYYLI